MYDGAEGIFLTAHLFTYKANLKFHEIFHFIREVAPLNSTVH